MHWFFQLPYLLCCCFWSILISFHRDWWPPIFSYTYDQLHLLSPSSSRFQPSYFAPTLLLVGWWILPLQQLQQMEYTHLLVIFYSDKSLIQKRYLWKWNWFWNTVLILKKELKIQKLLKNTRGYTVTIITKMRILVQVKVYNNDHTASQKLKQKYIFWFNQLQFVLFKVIHWQIDQSKNFIWFQRNNFRTW